MDIEHPDQPDPLKRAHPEQYQPETATKSDSAEVANATSDYRKSRKLAEAAGIDPAVLKMAKEII